MALGDLLSQGLFLLICYGHAEYFLIELVAMVHAEITLPRGVRDTLPEKTARRNALAQKILSVFEKNGYQEVTTPFLEFLDVLAQGAGKNLKKKIVKFSDRATGRSIAIRPDFTPQIARIVATHYRDREKTIRLSYHGSVIRLADDATGGQKELYQAGLELIGEASPEADAEVISLAIELLKDSGIKGFKVDIGQVEFVRGTLEEAGFSSAKKAEIIDAISKKDISRLTEMTTDVRKEHKAVLTAFPYLFGGEDVLVKAEKLAINDRSRQALNNIKAVVAILKDKGLSGYITIDLAEIRGFDYHTGIIFEGFVEGMGSPVCGGGRYDNLLENFGYRFPATGFAIDLDNLLSAIERQV